MMAVFWKTVGLSAVIILICGVTSSSSRPYADQPSSNEMTSKGFLIAASLTVIATICAIIAFAICTCCDGYEQFPGLSNARQSPAQTSNLFSPQPTAQQDISSVTIEPLPDVVNLHPKVISPPPNVNAPVTQQNVARKEWEKFDERTVEQQPMHPLTAPLATPSQISSHVHDIVDEQGVTCSPIVKQQKGLLQQHQLKPLVSTSTPEDEQKQQPAVSEHRMSTRAPPPLHLDDDVSIAPISTPALREAYVRNRAAVLQLSDDDIRAIPPAEREERVYQFLTPEEIWSLEGRIAALSVKSKPSMAPLDVAEWNSFTAAGEQHAVALSTLSDEHEAMRRALLDLPDGQLAQMPLAEIESFFPHLTAEEILGVQERVRRLQSLQDWSMRSANDSSRSLVSRRRSVLSDASRSYLRSLHSVLSVRSDSYGFFIEDDAIADEANNQSAWDVREMLLEADDDSLVAVDSDLLSKAFVYLTPEEIADTQQRVMLVKESRRATLLAATGAELRHMPAARLDSWLALLDRAEAAAVRSRMEEPEEPEEDVTGRPNDESASSFELADNMNAALKVDYDAKANWRLTPNMSPGSSPEPTTQPFDFSGEPPIVQVSQSEQLLTPDENDEEPKSISSSVTEKGSLSNETSPMTQSVVEGELPQVITQHDDVLEEQSAHAFEPGPFDHPVGVDDLELFLSADAPGGHKSADVSYESAVSSLTPHDAFSTPSKINSSYEADMEAAIFDEETVVGDLIDQVLESAGADRRTPTRSRSPESTL